MKFYIGMHIVAHVDKFENTFVSVNTIKDRKSCIHPRNWILDSGAFTQIFKYGEFQMPVPEYVSQINRWSRCGHLVAAVSQDYMCEQVILNKWNRTVKDHQKMTVDRYYQIVDQQPSVYVLPVIQGYALEEYLKCVDMYNFKDGDYVGIGSVCKRNNNVAVVADILKEVKAYSGVCLHGFGIKQTALTNPVVRASLVSSDSMAWSFNARAESNFTKGNRANDWTYAMEYYNKIKAIEGVV